MRDRCVSTATSTRDSVSWWRTDPCGRPIGDMRRPASAANGCFGWRPTAPYARRHRPLNYALLSLRCAPDLAVKCSAATDRRALGYVNSSGRAMQSSRRECLSARVHHLCGHLTGREVSPCGAGKRLGDGSREAGSPGEAQMPSERHRADGIHFRAARGPTRLDAGVGCQMGWRWSAAAGTANALRRAGREILNVREHLLLGQVIPAHPLA